MKKFRKLTALLLVLVLCLSFASATEVEAHDHTAETVSVETESPDRMTWSLDDGILTIGGKGIVKPIASAGEQPWAAVREQITYVRFAEDAHLAIDSIAHWFEGCVNLEGAEIPSYAFVFGDSAFSGCTKLAELYLYHSTDPEIAPTAFSEGEDIFICVTGPEAYHAVINAEWHGRGIEVFDLSEYPSTTFGSCGINGCTCSSCTWSYTYDDYNSDQHIRYQQCDTCSANEYAYGVRSDHVFASNGRCTYCGYVEDVSCSHGSTYNTWSGCTWYRYCNYCDEYLSSGTSHSYGSYGAWAYYSTSQHRRTRSCTGCGATSSENGSHSKTTVYRLNSDTQHSVVSHCDVCDSDIGSASLANHSLSYGSWASASATQHSRAKTCTLCDYGGTETGSHTDGNGDGKCDTCGYSMSVTITWDFGDGTTEATSQVVGKTLSLPSKTPSKENAVFSGWFTAQTGGSQVTEATVFTGSATTYYAQFSQTFSVTVPTVLPLCVDEDGEVYSSQNCQISNNSSGSVTINSVTLQAQNGWQIVPYATNMADEKVDAKLVGLQIRDGATKNRGEQEALNWTGTWEISKGSGLDLPYDAVISALSEPVTEEVILSVVFVLIWEV